MSEERTSVMRQAYSDRELSDLAEKMAQSRIDEMKKIGLAFGYARNQEKADENQRKKFRELANKYYMMMLDGSAFSDLDPQKLRDNTYDKGDLWKIAEGEYTPKQIDDKKLVAKYRGFFDLPETEKARLATVANYDWADPSSRGEFLDKIAQFNIEADRAEKLKEWDDSGIGILSSIFFPTMNEEGRKAIATGEGVDSKGKLYGLSAVDAAINTAIMAAPGLSGVGTKAVNAVADKAAAKVLPEAVKKAMKVPEVSNLVGALKQGVAESGREAVQGAFDVGDGSFDSSAPLTTAGLGATMSSWTRIPQMLGNDVAGEGVRDFGRGVTKATRIGDPALIEARKFSAALDDVGRFDNLDKLNPTQIARKSRADEAVKRKDVLKKALDYEGKAIDPKDIEGSVSKYEGIIPVKDGILDENAMNILNDFKGAFPMNFADLESSNAARKAGYMTGKLVADYGGRMEPAFKVASGKFTDSLKKDYKDSDWYKKLNEYQRKVFDDAYKHQNTGLLADEQPEQ